MIEPHTPLPWKADNLELQDMLSGTSCVYAEGYPLVSLNIGHGSHENAQYMAMACNEYPKLKEQNEKLIEAVKSLDDALETFYHNADNNGLTERHEWQASFEGADFLAKFDKLNAIVKSKERQRD